MSETPVSPSGEEGQLPTMVMVAGSDDLGWALAARRQEEGDRYHAQLERVRGILTDLDKDTNDRGLVLALERIADVCGVSLYGGSQEGPEAG